MLQVTDHSLTVHENGITNTISIGRATSVTGSINRRGHSKLSETSLEDKKSHHEKDWYTETGITSCLFKHFYIDMAITSALFTDT